MDKIQIDFAGIRLNNPIIAASAPPTETVENILKCAEAGVGAVITKTSAQYDKELFLLGGRRTHVDERGMWAQGTFRRETLPIKDGVQLVSDAVKQTKIPIIASVGNIDLDPNNWLNSCLAMQDAGASMIQLDLFYIPQPRSSSDHISQLIKLLTYLSTHLLIPVAPKLNIDFPPYLAAQFLKDTGIRAIFLLDSLRVPMPIDINKGGSPIIKNIEGAPQCSLFGQWQKPITLHYTSILYHELGISICAGGGLFDGNDAIEAMMLGATTVQFASVIIQKGYGEITKIQKELNSFMEQHKEYKRIEEVVGLAHMNFNWNGIENFKSVKFKVNSDICVRCGTCLELVFCNAIHMNDIGEVYIAEACDGCGLCSSECPIPGAIVIDDHQ